VRRAKRTSDNLDLGDTVGVTEDDTNLRRSGTLTGELADLVNDLLGGGLEPCGRSARVGDGAGCDTLSLGMKTAHFECRLWSRSCRFEGSSIARSSFSKFSPRIAKLRFNFGVGKRQAFFVGRGSRTSSAPALLKTSTLHFILHQTFSLHVLRALRERKLTALSGSA
jgi:hypothetical protein